MKKLILLVAGLLVIAGAVVALKPVLDKKSEPPVQVAADTKPAVSKDAEMDNVEKTIKEDLLKQEEAMDKKIKLTAEQKEQYEKSVEIFAKTVAPVIVEKEAKRAELKKANAPDADKTISKYEARTAELYAQAMGKFDLSLTDAQRKLLIEFRKEQANKK